MRVRLIALIAGTVLVCGVTRAAAVTLRDVVELSRAGLDPQVVIALIEVNDFVYDLDARRLLELKEAGIADRVLVALLRSGRERGSLPVPARTPSRATPTFDEPRAVVRRGPEAPPQPSRPRQTQTTVVQVPVMVPTGPLFSRVTQSVAATPQDPAVFNSFNARFPHAVGRSTASGSDRRYWGWGGQLRPGAWGQLHTGQTTTTTDTPDR